MKWVKGGLVYAPSGEHGWDCQYAHLPTATVLERGRVRVYFAALDANQFGRVGYVDLDEAAPGQVLKVAAEPALDLGDPGAFDDSGVNPSCLIQRGGLLYLFYIGWQRAARIPYALYAGLAVSEDGRKFRRMSRAPVLDRTDGEPFLRSATTILVEGKLMRCWYVSALRWTDVGGAPYPEYVIRYAESRDGLAWTTYGDICIGLVGDEFGIGRPWVMPASNGYRMWYSVRSRSAPYRLGYAESRDGLNWERKDSECVLTRSAHGWDSEMVCYPCVIALNGRNHMFYNGNRHGRTGFGYAVQDEAPDEG